MLLLAIAITLGNAVTLTVLMGSRRFRTPQGYLKASLAMADLAVGVLVIPYSIYTETMLHLLSGGSAQPSAPDLAEQGFTPCLLVGSVFAGCTLVSISTIFLLSVERSITVLRPLHKNVVVTKGRTLAVILLSWLLCFMLAVSPLLHSADITLAYSHCSKMCNYAQSAAGPQAPARNQSDTAGGWSIMLLFPAFDLTLLGATSLLNLVTFSAVRRFCRARKSVCTNAAHKRKGPTFSDLRAAKTILILTSLLSISVAPVAVLVVGSVAGLDWCRFSFYAFWILACSSGWNVLVYSARDRGFRLRARELFLGRRGRRKRSARGTATARSPTLGVSQCHSGHCVTVLRHVLTSDLTLALSLVPPETSTTNVSRRVALLLHSASPSLGCRRT
ncbi:cannabinoid receptor 1-like [Aplochiton taeniatus]